MLRDSEITRRLDALEKRVKDLERKESKVPATKPVKKSTKKKTGGEK